METFFIKVNGYKIRCAVRGKGPHLILIHGLGGSLEWWKFNFDYLSLKYHVVAFDFLGFGYSAKPHLEFNLDLASAFMNSFLESLKLNSVSLVGNSLGGLIALYTASEIRKRVEKLILVDNAGFGREISFLLRLATLYPWGEMALGLRNFLITKLFLSRLFYDRQKLPAELIRVVLKMFESRLLRKICLQVLRSGVNLGGLKKDIVNPIIKRAIRLEQPTLIIWGKNDKIIPAVQAYWGKNLIRNSKLVIFDKCGHLPQVEKWAEFNQLIVKFLG